MTETSARSFDRRWIWAAAFLALILVVLLSSHGSFDLDRLPLRPAERVLLYLLREVAPLLLLSGLMLGSRRAPNLAVFAMGVAAAAAALNIYTEASDAAVTLNRRAYHLLIFLQYVVTSTFVLLLLARFTHLVASWDWLRKALIGIIILVPVMDEGLAWVLPNIHAQQCVYIVVMTAALALVLFVSWGFAFRRGVPHRPPADAGRIIKLTCPRCDTAQEIATGSGECRHCRLQFHISLEEGVCAHCGYLLRGLKGSQCPECGRGLAGQTAT